LFGELLEERLNLSWAGAPPTSIAVPAAATAVVLSANDASGAAAIATTEVDYYAFTATANGTYTLSTTTPLTNVDTELGIFSATGQRIAYNDDISRTNTDSALSVSLTAGARYFVGVTNYSSATRGAYNWSIDGPSVGATPTDDAYENNDTFATAYNLGALTNARSIGSLAMADSQDFYKFTTSGTGVNGNSVSINFQHAQGDLDLALYNSVGTLLGQSQGVGNSETISLAGLAAGAYVVRVYGYRGVTNPSYSLNISPPSASARPTSTVDLAGATLSNAGATNWGQTVTVQASVHNSGTAASGAFTQQWYLSQDPTGSAGDVLLTLSSGATGYTVTNVGANSTSGQFSVTLQMPSALPSGWTGTSFYLVMRTDSAGLVAETNENNNFGQVGVGADSSVITVATPAGAGGFQIQLNMSGLTATQQAIFQAAARRWEQVIVGDLPNAVYRGQVVDDLLIDASARAIDGVNGILGQAGPDALRAGSLLPYHGSMQFDSADLASMEQSGLLYSVVLHEMGHVLGIGTIWSYVGLLSGAGGSNPTFTGVQATAAYNQIFGTSVSGVPVENGGGSGTADAHWRDSIFRSELMTGYAGPGVNLPLSRITVGSLADIGYTVNMAAADAYSPTGSSVLSALRATNTIAALTSAGLFGAVTDTSTSNGCPEPTGATSTSRAAINARGIDLLMATLGQNGLDSHRPRFGWM